MNTNEANTESPNTNNVTTPNEAKPMKRKVARKLNKLEPFNINFSKECVVFLHGLGRSSRSFRKDEKFFSKVGFKTLNVDYPSTRHKIEDLAELFLKPELKAANLDIYEKVHFVTHSMGGIVLREFLAHNTLNNLGKVVMLAPPNQGSKRAETACSVVHFFAGPALDELVPGPSGICHRLPAADFELGVIASPIDRKVSVEEAKIDDTTPLLKVRRYHTFIMRAPEVIRAAFNFITTGEFDQ